MNKIEPRPDIRHPGPPPDLHLRLFTANTQRIAAERWPARDLRSPFWRLYANDSDGMEVELHDPLAPSRHVPLRGGHLYLIPSGVHFSGQNPVAVDHFYVHFEIIGPPPLLVWTGNSETLNRVIEVPGGSEDGRWPAKIAELAAQSRTLPDAPMVESVAFRLGLRIKALVYEALALSLPELDPSTLPDASSLDAVRPALLYIENHLGNPLSNAELASLCHFCTDHFIVRFRESIGLTPGQYLMERRLSVAAQNLLFTRATVDEISASLGFCDRFHFSRAFRNRYGTPPAAYRKSQRV